MDILIGNEKLAYLDSAIHVLNRPIGLYYLQFLGASSSRFLPRPEERVWRKGSVGFSPGNHCIEVNTGFNIQKTALANMNRLNDIPSIKYQDQRRPLHSSKEKRQAHLQTERTPNLPTPHLHNKHLLAPPFFHPHPLHL